MSEELPPGQVILYPTGGVGLQPTKANPFAHYNLNQDTFSLLELGCDAKGWKEVGRLYFGKDGLRKNEKLNGLAIATEEWRIRERLKEVGFFDYGRARDKDVALGSLIAHWTSTMTDVQVTEELAGEMLHLPWPATRRETNMETLRVSVPRPIWEEPPVLVAEVEPEPEPVQPAKDESKTETEGLPGCVSVAFDQYGGFDNPVFRA